MQLDAHTQRRLCRAANRDNQDCCANRKLYGWLQHDSNVFLSQPAAT